jgi:flagellar hook-basal body complex protein FliE
MLNSITQSTAAAPGLQSTRIESSNSTGAPAFKDMLLDSIQEVNAAQLEADKAVENLFTGGDANPAEVLTAVQKADLAFKMMMQVRNKLVQAYQEIKEIRV